LQLSDQSGVPADTGLSQIDFDALQRLSIDEGSDPSVADAKSPVYADGTQVTRVSGDVLRWRKDTEAVERFNAQTYIKDCESEINRLRDQVRPALARGSLCILSTCRGYMTFNSEGGPN